MSKSKIDSNETCPFGSDKGMETFFYKNYAINQNNFLLLKNGAKCEWYSHTERSVGIYNF